MSIEEKAKAYDKALSKAREYHFQGQAPDKLAELESIFPELVESDDERIRKSLIRFLTDIKEISESGRASWAIRKEDAEMCKSFIIYLEKQKDAFENGRQLGIMQEQARQELEWPYEKK